MVNQRLINHGSTKNTQFACTKSVWTKPGSLRRSDLIDIGGPVTPEFNSLMDRSKPWSTIGYIISYDYPFLLTINPMINHYPQPTVLWAQYFYPLFKPHESWAKHVPPPATANRLGTSHGGQQESQPVQSSQATAMYGWPWLESHGRVQLKETSSRRGTPLLSCDHT